MKNRSSHENNNFSVSDARNALGFFILAYRAMSFRGGLPACPTPAREGPVARGLAAPSAGRVGGSENTVLITPVRYVHSDLGQIVLVDFRFRRGFGFGWF